MHHGCCPKHCPVCPKEAAAVGASAILRNNEATNQISQQKPSMPSPPRNQPRPRTIEPHRVSAATANPSAGPSGLDRVKPG
jgi:hypothetical protein